MQPESNQRKRGYVMAVCASVEFVGSYFSGGAVEAVLTPADSFVDVGILVRSVSLWLSQPLPPYVRSSTTASRVNGLEHSDQSPHSSNFCSTTSQCLSKMSRPHWHYAHDPALCTCPNDCAIKIETYICEEVHTALNPIRGKMVLRLDVQACIYYSGSESGAATTNAENENVYGV